MHPPRVFYILLILIIPSIFPLLFPGFIKTDDGEWMVVRLSAFHQALSNGQLPVRFLPRLNHEYGYPVANFLYPGFMYLAEPFHVVLGFSFTDSVKIILGISLITSFIFIYFWLKTFFSKFSAVIGGLLYLYAPYHLVDVYRRGSVGEVLALSVIPFILWSFEKKNLFFASLGIGLLVISHNTLAVIFMPILFFYHLLRFPPKIRREFLFLILPFILGLLLSAFFWLPALWDLKFTNFKQIKIVNLDQYFKQPEIVLLSNLLLIFLGIILVFLKRIFSLIKKSKPEIKNIAIFFVIIGLGSILLNLANTKFLWSMLPVNFIQFPFRLLSIEIISISFLMSFIIDTIKRKKLQYILGFISFLFFTIPVVFFIPKIEHTDRGDAYYATNEDTTTVKNEYMPIWVKQYPIQRPDKIIEGENITYQSIKRGYKITFFGNFERTIIFNQVYFPGWIAYANGKELPIYFANPKGIMKVRPTINTKEVRLLFTETPLRLFSDFLTLMGIILVVLVGMKQKIIMRKIYEA